MHPLRVDRMTFYPKLNAKDHNTDKFDVMDEEYPTTAIVRRGQTFIGSITFKRPYDESEDLVRLNFDLGNKHPMGVKASVYLGRNVIADKNEWTANVKDIVEDDKRVVFEVSTPVTLPVGEWSASVVTSLKHSSVKTVYNFNEQIYILFNPWNPDDQTYMKDSNLLQEYVLNDIGKIWASDTESRPWSYGQFDSVVLPACMFILKKSSIPFHQQGDPVKLARAVSRIVNANEDNGVLVGRWKGEYSDGTDPRDWTGSVDILAQYMKTQVPVRYGQCWVFGAIVTTVCRALGIPSRTITNLDSAHDSDESLSIDKYYENSEELKLKNEKKRPIWNFHVWNDVWMARPDLPLGYGGWQALDSTPQELSQGMSQCGPAPVEAVKQGVIGLDYDVAFVLSEVNADVLEWMKDPEAERGYSVVETDENEVGRKILTKKPFMYDPEGNEDQEDITNLYKYKEGTTSERLALMNAVRRSEKAMRYYGLVSELNKDVTFKLRELDTVFYGENFTVAIEIQNNSNEGRNIKAMLLAKSIFYNGTNPVQVKNKESEIYVGPHKKEVINMMVKAEDYLPKLVEYHNIRVYAMAIVNETKYAWGADKNFQIVTPKIKIKCSELLFNQPATVELSLKNPLDKPLTDCEFRLEVSGIATRTLHVVAEDAEPYKTVIANLKITPTKVGKIHFIATFKSAELKGINGAAHVEVLDGVHHVIAEN